MCQIWNSQTLLFLTKSSKIITQRCFLTTTTHQQRKNHYETLGVKSSATAKEIRDAFVSRSKKVHPDMNHGDPKLHGKFVRLNEAYSTLIKPTSRRKYDESIGVAFYYKDPTFREMNPRPGNPYQYGPPPPPMGAEQFYQEMLREARRDTEQRQKRQNKSKAHATPFYTFSPFFITLGSFTALYWLFVYDNENDRHNRIKTAHELRWKLMEEENKVLMAQGKLRPVEAPQSGSEEPIDHTHVKAVRRNGHRQRRDSLRERKRLAKKEALQKAKGKTSDKKKPSSETDSESKDDIGTGKS